MGQPASNHHASFLEFTEFRLKWALATHEHRIPAKQPHIACNARLFHVCHLPGKHKALWLADFFPKSKVNIPRSNCDHVVRNIWDAILKRKAPLFGACKDEAASVGCNPLDDWCANVFLSNGSLTSLLNNPRVQMVAAPIRVLQQKARCFFHLVARWAGRTCWHSDRQKDRQTDGPAWSGMKNFANRTSFLCKAHFRQGSPFSTFFAQQLPPQGTDFALHECADSEHHFSV